MSARKITDDVIERLCVHLRAARPLATACRLEGVKRDTLYELMDGNEGVRDAIERARAIGEDSLLGKLDAGITDGKATGGVQWWLEKLYPKRWGKQAVQRSEVSGPKGGAQEIKLSIEQATEGARKESE